MADSNPSPEQNLPSFEELEKRVTTIKTPEDLVTTFRDIKNRCKQSGLDEKVRIDYLKKLEEIQSRRFEEIKALKDAKEEGRSEAIQRLSQWRKQLRFEINHKSDPRYKKFDEAWDWANEQSNPDRKSINEEEVIDDYPGTEHHNANNDIHNKFRGYLAALKLSSEEEGKKAYDLALLAFKAHDKDFFGDRVLDEQDLMDTVGMKKYVDLIQKNGIDINALEPEALGFLIGNLKTAEPFSENDKETYWKYLCGELKKMIEVKELSYDLNADPEIRQEFPDLIEGEIKEENMSNDFKQAIKRRADKYQLQILVGLQTPHEWQEQQHENTRVALREFQTKVAGFTGSTDDSKIFVRDFRLDPAIQTLVAKDLKNVTAKDKETIDSGETKLGQNIAKYLQEKQKELPETLKGLKKEMDELETKNPKLKDNDDWKNLRKIYDSIEEDLKSLKVDQKDSLEALQKQWDLFLKIAGEIKGFQEKFDPIKEKIEAEKPATKEREQEQETETPDKKGREIKEIEEEELGETTSGGGDKKGSKKTGPEFGKEKYPKDPYEEKWAEGRVIENRYAGYKGKLRVSPHIEDPNAAPLYSEAGKFIRFVPRNTEFTVVHGQESREVGGDEFVNVNYNGEIFWVLARKVQKLEPQWTSDERKSETQSSGIKKGDEVQPQRGKGSEEEEHEPEQEHPQKSPESGLEALVGMPIKSEYRQALEKIMADSEKPEGALFDLRFNKKITPLRLKKMGEKYYVMRSPETSDKDKEQFASYNDLRAALVDINSGHFLEKLTHDQLLDVSNFESYEEKVGRVKELLPADKNEVYLQLDWLGVHLGKGNPQIWAKAEADGGISYRIKREFVGINGENSRKGYAANFDDLMRHLIYIREWSEPKKYREAGPDGKQKEQVFADLMDIRNFYQHEATIGRPVYFSIEKPETKVVKMFLDWGGGIAGNTNYNPRINMWVNDNGGISFSMKFDGRGIIEKTDSAANMDEMFQKLAVWRQGGEVKNPQRQPTLRREPISEREPVKKPETKAEKGAQWPNETADQKVERNRLADQLKKNLMMLTEDDAKLEATGHSVSKMLDEAAALLTELKSKYPYDPDVFVLGKAYEDLRNDFKQHRETDLDDGFEVIVQQMRQEIARSGVQKISMDHISEVKSSALRGTVERLRGLNIQPSYVVESANPNAKTVVLFMQTHPEPSFGKNEVRIGGGSTYKEFKWAMDHPDRQMRSMESSQAEIRDAIIAGVQSGMMKTAYEEGLPRGFSMPNLPANVPLNKLPEVLDKLRKEAPPEFAKAFETGSLQAKLVLGDSLELKGYDFDQLKMKILQGKADFIYRAHAHNAFIASNLSDYVEGSIDEVSFLTIGAAHEAYPNSTVEHHLPLSQTMAYYGMNVVVVDTTYTPPVS